MIAWELAERVAAGLGGEGAGGDAMRADVVSLAKDAERAVLDYSQLAPLGALPVPELVARGTWSRANVRLLRTTIGGLEGRIEDRTAGLPGAARAVAGGVIGAEVGALVGYLSRRVLGQYEVALTPGEPPDPARLYLVAENVSELAEQIDAPAADLLAWVTVHEVTHAVQFSAVPWLRPHLGSLVEQLMESTEVDLNFGSLRPPTLDDARTIWERARTGGVVGALAGSARGDLLAQVQSTMALVEGHAEHVMDAAGVGMVSGLDRLRSALERRRDERSPLAALLERLIGMDLKLRQYRDGKRFCDEVVGSAGIAALNRAWQSPELLPTASELADPGSWLERSRRRELPPGA